MPAQMSKRARRARRLTHGLVLSAVAALPLNMALAHAAPGRPDTAVRLAAASLAKPMAVTAPTPGAPAPAPAAAAPSVAEIIRAAALRAGANPVQLLRVAECESGLNPLAYNRRSGASGLFQFLPAVFRAHGGTDIWDPYQQADVAARMFAAGWAYQWSCR